MTTSEFRTPSLVEIEVYIFHETEKAILVWTDDTDRERAVWIPISRCEIHRKGNNIAELTMTENLATEKGLV